MAFIGFPGLSPEGYLKEVKLVVPPEIPEAKRKLLGSADEAMRKRGGRLSMVGGMSTLPETNFPIVGINASAGGLEAQEVFRANLPAESDMAFVIVQHLDPTYKGMMVELLQQHKDTQVFQIKGRKRAEANCVHVIPPYQDLSIQHGALHLLDPLARRGLHLPIDLFIPLDWQEKAGESNGYSTS